MNQKNIDSISFFCLEKERKNIELLEVIYQDKIKEQECYFLVCKICGSSKNVKNLRKIKGGYCEIKCPNNHRLMRPYKQRTKLKKRLIKEKNSARPSYDELDKINFDFIKRKIGVLPTNVVQSKTSNFKESIEKYVRFVKMRQGKYKFNYENFFNEIIMKTGHVKDQEKSNTSKILGKRNTIGERFVRDFYFQHIKKYKFKSFDEFIELFIYTLSLLEPKEFHVRLINLKNLKIIDETEMNALHLLHTHARAYYAKKYGGSKRSFILGLNAFNLKHSQQGANK